MVKYKINTKVHIKGTFLKGKKGTIKRIGRTNDGRRIFYVAPSGSNFTTAMLNNQIKFRENQAERVLKKLLES